MSDLPSSPGGTSPHVIVDDVSCPVLDESDRHHLAKVRRLRSGDLLSVTDGRGSWRWCSFGDELTVVGPVVVQSPPTSTLTVGFALVKGEKPELVVQKLTEIGIDVIIPFVAGRSVVRWDEEKTTRQRDRLLKVAREASMQCRRLWLPDVRSVATFSEVASIEGAAIADRYGVRIDAGHRVVLIGPEGGWSDSERTLPAVGLGANVLRAETAAITAAALMVDRRNTL